MKQCVWVRLDLVNMINYLPSVDGADLLRHSKFGGLREDKNPREVVDEG